MPQRLSLIPVMLLALLILTACTPKTALHFTNETDCGTATITLTHLGSGTLSDYTAEPDITVEIEVEPDTDYRYTVTYPRQPDGTQCDPKVAAARLKKGTTLNITLESVIDPAPASFSPGVIPIPAM